MTVPKEKDGWLFMGREYRTGDVVDYMSLFRPWQAVAGLHIGENTSRLRFARRDGGGRGAFLGGCTQAPSRLRYELGRALICEEAGPGDIFGFKLPPKYWDEPAATNRSYGEALRDYIAALWSRARRMEPQLAELDGGLVVAVGCPLDPDWTGAAEMGKLTRLVEAATGSPAVAVPEPLAAVIDAAALDDGFQRNAEERFWLMNGSIALRAYPDRVEAEALYLKGGAPRRVWRPGCDDSPEGFVRCAVRDAVDAWAGSAAVTGGGEYFETVLDAARSSAGRRGGGGLYVHSASDGGAVAGGLCKAFAGMSAAGPQVNAAWSKTVKGQIGERRTTLIEHVSERLYLRAAKRAAERLKALAAEGGTHTHSEIVEAVMDAAAAGGALQEDFAAEWGEYFPAYAADCAGKGMSKAVNAVCRALYGDTSRSCYQGWSLARETWECPCEARLPDSAAQALLRQLAGSVGYSPGRNAANALVKTLVAIETWGTSLFIDELAPKGYGGESDEVSPERCGKLAAAFETPNEKAKRRAARAIAGAIGQDGALAAAFTETMSEAFELALGEALLCVRRGEGKGEA